MKSFFGNLFSNRKEENTPSGGTQASPAPAKTTSNKSVQEATVEWSKNMHYVVRLAFRDVIYKEGGYYCIAMKDRTLRLKNCPTLVDVYLYIYHQNDNFKKEINDLYEEKWSTAHIVELLQNPDKYREKMEKVHEQAKQELPLFTSRPSVGKDDFAICPRRSGLLALTLIEQDLKTVRN